MVGFIDEVLLQFVGESFKADAMRVERLAWY